jgi:hypothetical protein
MTTAARTRNDPLEATLKQLGFTHSRHGDGHRLNGVLFTQESKWAVLQAVEPSPQDDPLRGQLGKPGLWKQAPVEGRSVRVFDLPLAACSGRHGDDEDTAVSPLEACLRWALMTLDGKLPVGWQTPARDEVEGLIPQGGLTVQVGPFVRQGTLIHRPDRLAVSFPLLPRVSENLSANRMSWLRELLGDGQRCRMVRLGMTGGPTDLAVYAEVDLSGAPPGSVECLFKTGLDCLRWVVHELVGSAAFLADSSLVCRSLEEVCPMAVQSAERKVKA